MLEDCLSVWASHAMESIEEYFEIRMCLEKFLDQREIKDILQHLDVVCGGINNLNLQVPISLCANCSNVDFWDVRQLVGSQSFGSCKDLICNGLWSWSTVCKVVLDAKVILGA